MWFTDRRSPHHSQLGGSSPDNSGTREKPRGRTGSSIATGKKNVTLLARFCKERVPRSCEHSLLANDTRYPRPCSLAESFLTSGDSLTLELKLADSSALRPVTFKALYEFVDLHVDGEPFGDGPCSRKFGYTTSNKVPDEGISTANEEEGQQKFRSPRDVFLYGRGGARNLSCVYRFESPPDLRVKLTLTSVVVLRRRCETRSSGGRLECVGEMTPSATVSLHEKPWPDVPPVERHCLCHVRSQTLLPFTYVSASNVVEIRFNVVGMNASDDFDTLSFEGSWKFIKTPSCSKDLRYKGASGQLIFTHPPHHSEIIQWNARSLRSNRLSMQQLFGEQEFDIALVSETWLKPTQTFKYKNFNIIRKDRGVAILLSSRIQYDIISLTDNFNQGIEVCAIDITIADKKISVLSLYKPPNVKATVQDYSNIFSQLRYDCIIGGDFNANHEIWGSSMSSSDGNILVEALDSFHDLIIANDGSATRMSQPGKNKSVVDLSPFYNWSPLSDTYGSDHFPIVIVLNSVHIESYSTSPISKWSMKGVDWKLYQSEIEKEFIAIPSFSIITRAANKACKTLKPFCVKSQSPPWWDEECTFAVSRRKNAMRIYKCNRIMTNFIEYKRLDALCKRTFQTKARIPGRSFVSSPTTIWKRVNRITNTKSNYFVDKTAIETLFLKIAPSYVTPPFHSYSTEHEQHFLLSPIERDELVSNIHTTKSSAPGMDGINYAMINNLPTVAIDFLYTFTHVVKSSSACCVRLCSWPCNSSAERASPKRNFSADANCESNPRVIVPSSNKYLYVKIKGLIMKHSSRMGNNTIRTVNTGQRCDIATRIIVHTALYTAVICPTPNSYRDHLVEVFSEGWHLKSDQNHVIIRDMAFDKLEIDRLGKELPRTIAIEFYGKEEGEYVTDDCRYRCPELDACINPSVWCDGVEDCPSGVDEALSHCSLLLNLPPLYLALDTGIVDEKGIIC
nr:unnamed protein product [Callosobruchus chinensis]